MRASMHVSKACATPEKEFICTCAGFCGVAKTWFATGSGRRVIAGAGADAMDTHPGTFIIPFRPMAVQHRTIMIQRAPALLGTIAG